MPRFAVAVWLIVLHASVGGHGAALATPFAIELTIPDAHGSVLSNTPGGPNTPFTAPYIVVRVTGDTENVIATYPNRTLYQGSTFRISIPGIGSGARSDPDFAVSVGAGSLSFTFPAYPTAFSSGAAASDPTLTSSDLRASVGPISVQDAYTFHWGPTSAMIGFTTDDGKSGTVAAGRTPGVGPGTLEISVGGTAPNPIVTKTYSDLAAFLAASGPTTIATFENASPSALPSFQGLSIVESLPIFSFPNLLDLPEQYWFGTLGSPSHFALAQYGTTIIGTTKFKVLFPTDVVTAGFLYNCYTCRPDSVLSAITWTTHDANGNVIEHGTLISDLPGAAAASNPPAPRFFALTTPKPFRALTIDATTAATAAPEVLIDDIRYATVLASGEQLPPSAAIPTLGSVALSLVSLAVLMVGCVYSRKGAHRPRR
jgi:hypothetical protein